MWKLVCGSGVVIFVLWGRFQIVLGIIECFRGRHNSQDTQPPLTPRQGLDYRGGVPDASPSYKPKFLQYRACSAGILQKKRRTTGKKALAYRGKGGQNTDTDFLALRLGVVLYLLNRGGRNFTSFLRFSGPFFFVQQNEPFLP